MKIAFIEDSSGKYTGPRQYRDRVERALSTRHEIGFFRTPPVSGWDVLHVLDVKRAPVRQLKRVHMPVVADVHDHYWAEFVAFPTPDLPLRWMLQKSRNRHYRRVFSMSNAVVAHTKIVARHVEHPNLHVVPYGLDYEAMHPPAENTRESSLLLLVGRDCLRKGLPAMVKALRIILKTRPETRLVVIGDEYWHTRLWSKLISRGLPVRFIEGMDFSELVKWYHRASVLTLPSYIETFPFTVLDAFASGLPVVASAVGGIPEQVEEGENGFLVRPGDSKDLASKILMILDGADLGRRLAGKGFERLKRAHGQEAMADGLEKVYRSVVRG